MKGPFSKLLYIVPLPKFSKKNHYSEEVIHDCNDYQLRNAGNKMLLACVKLENFELWQNSNRALGSEGLNRLTTETISCIVSILVNDFKVKEVKRNVLGRLFGIKFSDRRHQLTTLRK